MSKIAVYNPLFKTFENTRAWLLEKNYITCNMLEYIVFMHAEIGRYTLSIDDIANFTKHAKTISKMRLRDEKIECVLRDLRITGVIRLNFVKYGNDNPIQKEVIELTEEGIQLYCKQTFQTSLATMLEAEESRRLALKANIIAILSIIVSALLVLTT